MRVIEKMVTKGPVDTPLDWFQSSIIIGAHIRQLEVKLRKRLASNSSEGCHPKNTAHCYVPPQLNVLNASLLDDKES